MADSNAAHPPPGDGSAWTADEVARYLVPDRDRFVAQLPHEIASARDLTQDQRELAIDEALDFIVTEYARPIMDAGALERAFWATASNRVRRAHEGRTATIRRGWRRLDVDRLELPAQEAGPEEHAIEQAERALLLEFAATLTARERVVLACKYGGGRRTIGRRVMARRLDLPIGEVRKCERAIDTKLARFALIISAGTLCDHRDPTLTALAVGSATPEQELAARLHISHCARCRAAYSARVRAVRSGEFQRRLAELLPLPPVADSARDRGFVSAWIDWLSKPFAHESAGTAAHLGASGVGRGMATAGALKLATICLGAATVVGGGAYCVDLQLGDKQTHKPAPRPMATAQPHPTARLHDRMPLAASSRSKPMTAPTKKSTQRSRSNRTNAPTAHETSVVSPVPANAAPGGASEFGPANPAPAVRPAAAPSTGPPEFP